MLVKICIMNYNTDSASFIVACFYIGTIIGSKDDTTDATVKRKIYWSNKRYSGIDSAPLLIRSKPCICQ